MSFERGSLGWAKDLVEGEGVAATEELKGAASPGSGKKLLIGEPISDISEGEEDEEAEGGKFKPRHFSLPREENPTENANGLAPVIGDEDLEDFEEQEREIARLLQSEREGDEDLHPLTTPQQLDLLTAGESEDPRFASTESLQNRQSSAFDLHPDSPVSESDTHFEHRSPSFESRDETGIPFNYTAAPPPSYSAVLENDRAKSARAVAREPLSPVDAIDENSKNYAHQQHDDDQVGKSEYTNNQQDSAREEEADSPRFSAQGHQTENGFAVEEAVEPIEYLLEQVESEEIRLQSSKEGMALENAQQKSRHVEEKWVGSNSGVSNADPSVFIPAGIGTPAEDRDSPQPPPIVTEELKDLFRLVDESSAEKLDIPVVLKPFLLDYIPAVGDVDPFIKIPRIDGVDDQLGLAFLDEPSRQQSDPMVLDMKLRQKQPGTSANDIPVKKLGRVYKNAHQIDKWIANVKEMRKTRPPDRVHYSRPMPDIDRLMQEWSPEMEASLAKVTLPSAELDVPLEEYVDICLSLADIPVHKSRIQSLHLLFSLYSEFKASQHFRNLAANNLYDEVEEEGVPSQTNRLEL